MDRYEVIKSITDNDGRVCKPGETVSLYTRQAFYLCLSGKIKPLTTNEKQAKKKQKGGKINNG